MTFYQSGQFVYVAKELVVKLNTIENTEIESSLTLDSEEFRV